MRSGWPLVERRRNDRRKADRRQRDRAESSGSTDLRRARELDSHKAKRVCTARELEVLGLLLQGMTNKQIAQRLRIAEDTVKKHLQHIYRKLEVHRRALLLIGVGKR